MPNIEELPITPAGGNAFIANPSWFTRDGDPGAVTFVVHNRSHAWICPNIIRDNGSYTSPNIHIQDGEDWQWTEAIQVYANNPSYIKRWRPGVFGIAGDGGGIVNFTIPADAKGAYIEVTITG